MKCFIHSQLLLRKQQTWKCKKKLSYASSGIHLLRIFEILGQVVLSIFCANKITLEWNFRSTPPPPPLLCLTRISTPPPPIPICAVSNYATTWSEWPFTQAFALKLPTTNCIKLSRKEKITSQLKDWIAQKLWLK